jgi:hypothetical protein
MVGIEFQAHLPITDFFLSAFTRMLHPCSILSSRHPNIGEMQKGSCMTPFLTLLDNPGNDIRFSRLPLQRILQFRLQKHPLPVTPDHNRAMYRSAGGTPEHSVPDCANKAVSGGSAWCKTETARGLPPRQSSQPHDRV